MNSTITHRRLAKIRFFAIYFLSIFLIVLLLSSFFQFDSSPDKTLAGTADQRAALDELLHRRMEPLQVAAASYRENGNTEKDQKRVEAEKAVFIAVIDSIRRITNDISNEDEKAEVERLLKSFTLAAEGESRVLQNTSFAVKETTSGIVDNAEMEQLKTILADKETRIAELEQEKNKALDEKNKALTALQNKTGTQPTLTLQKNDAGAEEWKEKYNKLKSSAEKSTSQLDALKASYKEVVEDNRRLITQLQAARAGKN